MTNRAKLTLEPIAVNSDLAVPGADASPKGRPPRLKVVKPSGRVRKQRPKKQSGLAKNLLVLGLIAASLIIFKQKLA